MTYFADKAPIKLADNRSALSTPVTSSVVARNRPLMTVDLRGVAYAASRISSTLKGSTKQFGWLQAPATTELALTHMGTNNTSAVISDSSSETTLCSEPHQGLEVLLSPASQDSRREQDFQSRIRSFGAPVYVPSPGNTSAMILVSAISVVAGAHNQMQANKAVGIGPGRSSLGTAHRDPSPIGIGRGRGQHIRVPLNVS
jgi:hypothetical protein